MQETYRMQWKNVVQKYAKYKKLKVVNVDLLDSIDHKEELYVIPCFMKPGKQCYMVKQQDNDLVYGDTEWFHHKCLAPVREEDVAICNHTC